MELTQDCLSDILRASERKITIEEIQRKVSEHYNIRLSDMIGPKRVRSYARPRQVAMYLSKNMTSRSLPEIGRRFGGRDHTTVMHGVKRIEELKVQDGQIAEDLELLRRALEALSNLFIHISGTLRPCGPLSLDAHVITSENHGATTVRWCECTLAGFLWED